jgi:hypothetical protein
MGDPEEADKKIKAGWHEHPAFTGFAMISCQLIIIV